MQARYLTILKTLTMIRHFKSGNCHDILYTLNRILVQRVLHVKRHTAQFVIELQRILVNTGEILQPVPIANTAHMTGALIQLTWKLCSSSIREQWNVTVWAAIVSCITECSACWEIHSSVNQCDAELLKIRPGRISHEQCLHPQKTARKWHLMLFDSYAFHCKFWYP